MLRSLEPLTADQLAAVETGSNIWLSASAGTGKTQVLAARVIRLLLEDSVRPENLLCITYTKAGATEMAERINDRLASWVQMDDKPLFRDLEAIGVNASPDVRAHARKLFASVLDAPGGGLQIMTIHSLCQALLASFPEEAGLIPGFKPVEGREEAELHREALSEMILSAEQSGDQAIIANLQSLSLSLGEDDAQKFLKRCAGQPDIFAELPEGQGMVIGVRRRLDIEFDGSPDDLLAKACADGEFDRHMLVCVAELNEKWGTARGMARAETIRLWLAADIVQRMSRFDGLHRAWATADGEPMIASKGYTPPDAGYAEIALDLFRWTDAVQEQRAMLDYAERLASALIVGKAYATRYGAAKHVRGVVDFNDMIRRTAALLQQSGMADWIRYKLDQRIDHILVDEAQDSNVAQWEIVKALSDDFFSGLSAKDGRCRTIFAVGDYKQAIYGFQGTDPEKYVAAGAEFGEKITASGGDLQNLALSESFRSTQPVMALVNAVIATKGAEAMGINSIIAPHYSKKADIGLIELFDTVNADDEDDSDDGDDGEEDGTGWVSNEKRDLAAKLAGHVAELIRSKPVLATTGQPLKPRDIMILLRSRSSLASALVAQLHRVNVAVAGVDRLQLLQPLAVQDLLSVIRFALQPDDDYSLACILVSPLLGWSQEDLLSFGYRSQNISLWQHLRSQPALAGRIAPLRDILSMADFTTSYGFFERILSGPIEGRKKLVARLGTEALVPVEELLNAALQFGQNQGGTLQAFLDWFERDDSEIKRDGVAGNDEVRIMTVHGAKGLQAPVVILADAAVDPDSKRQDQIDLLYDDGRKLPLIRYKKELHKGVLGEAAADHKKRDLNEFFRLLYVAITRSEERLIIAGSLGKRKKAVAENSWYAAVQAAMAALGCEWDEDRRWGRVMRLVGGDGIFGAQKATAAKAVSVSGAADDSPGWLVAPAPVEQRPPRPLVPSRLDDDDYGDAPSGTRMQAAAERGKLIHALFERVTGTVSIAVAEQWLAANVRDPAIDTGKIIADVKAVVGAPGCAAFFGPAAKAEVPLAAVVGDMVISGRIDRLLVEPGLVRAIDFKTGRSVPADERKVAVPYLRQMAHYAAALQAIFPDSRIEMSLLFTAGPRLITLSDAVLAPYKPAS